MYITENGHYLSLYDTATKEGKKARISTSYLNTTGKCVIVYVLFTGTANGIVNIITRNENLQETIIK